MCMQERVGRIAMVVGVSMALGAAPSLTAQTIRGKLLEQITERPVANAAVSLVAAPGAKVAQTTTSGSGDFVLKAPSPGTYRVRAVINGYRTAESPAVNLRAGDDISFTWHIMPDTLYLAPIVVTANNRRSGKLGGFFDRQKTAAGGKFITRDEIDKRHPVRVTDLLATVPGIRLVPGLLGEDVVTTEGCRPAVYIDGLQYPLMGERLDNVVSPQDVEAIEVYPHLAETPPEFVTPGQQCGAIVIWTRTGP